MTWYSEAVIHLGNEWTQCYIPLMFQQDITVSVCFFLFLFTKHKQISYDSLSNISSGIPLYNPMLKEILVIYTAPEVNFVRNSEVAINMPGRRNGGS